MIWFPSLSSQERKQNLGLCLVHSFIHSSSLDCCCCCCCCCCSHLEDNLCWVIEVLQCGVTATETAHQRQGDDEPIHRRDTGRTVERTYISIKGYTQKPIQPHQHQHHMNILLRVWDITLDHLCLQCSKGEEDQKVKHGHKEAKLETGGGKDELLHHTHIPSHTHTHTPSHTHIYI